MGLEAVGGSGPYRFFYKGKVMAAYDQFENGKPDKASDGPAFKKALGNSGRLQKSKARKAKSPVAGLSNPKALPVAGTAQAKITWDKRLSDAMKGMK